MKLGTQEARQALQKKRMQLLEEETAEAMEARREFDRIKAMMQRGAPIRPDPEWMAELRRKMWKGGKAKTVSVRGHEGLPVDRAAARVTRSPVDGGAR